MPRSLRRARSSCKSRSRETSPPRGHEPPAVLGLERIETHRNPRPRTAHASISHTFTKNTYIIEAMKDDTLRASGGIDNRVHALDVRDLPQAHHVDGRCLFSPLAAIWRLQVLKRCRSKNSPGRQWSRGWLCPTRVEWQAGHLPRLTRSIPSRKTCRSIPARFDLPLQNQALFGFSDSLFVVGYES